MIIVAMVTNLPPPFPVNRVSACCFLTMAWLLSSCSFENSTNSAYKLGSLGGVFAAEDSMFVIGVEKYDRENVGYSRETDVMLKTPSAETHPELASRHPRELAQLTREVDGYLHQEGSRVLTVSHILACNDRGQVSFPYNNRSYVAGGPNLREQEQKAFASGQDAVARWARSDLRRAFQEAQSAGKPFTHVFVMCMGWVNDQRESTMRFRNVAVQVTRAAREKGDTRFRALVIGVTWPSGWLTNSDVKALRHLGHAFSYPNKSNDADELGIRVISPLVFQHIRPCLPQGVVLVGIGHSFGARAMSRAAYSHPMLRGSKGSQFDILVSLQGAYSLKRWLPGLSWEGAPYVISQQPLHFVTSSEHDTSNAIAFWSSHVGGADGLRGAKRYPSRFQTATWLPEADQLDRSALSSATPVIVDARTLAQGKPDESLDVYGNESRSAHNDMLNAETGRFIYHLLSTQLRY